MWKLVLLFTLTPAVELYLLIRIGQWLGPLETVLLILITGVVGAWLAKREGLSVLRQLQVELSQGVPPGSRLVEGALVVAGGLLLVTPGVLTDLGGFLFILPPTRRLLAPLVLRWLAARFRIRDLDVHLGPGGPGAPPTARPPREEEFDFTHPRR